MTGLTGRRRSGMGALVDEAGSGGMGSWSGVVGRVLPSFELPSCPGPVASLGDMGRSSSLVVCVAPGVGSSPAVAPGGIDVDTARARAWRPYVLELAALGYRLVWVSACPCDVQRDWAEREDLGYVVLSDEGLQLARVLGLPTRTTLVGRRYEHLTLLARGREIVQAFRPAPSPGDARGVTAWISWFDA
jgi:peroxiredoxin